MDKIVLSDSVLEAIRSGRAKMHSKWYFVLRNALVAVALLILLLIAIFLASFIIFVLHGQSIWFVPVFGLSGWYALFNSLPVILVIFSLVFITMLAIFVRRYPSGYQWPLVYSMLGIFFLIAGVTAWFVQTSVYQELFSPAPISPTIPFLGQYYPGIGVLTSDEIHRGQIIAFTADGFYLLGADGTHAVIRVASSTNFPAGMTFATGDAIVVFGPENKDGSVNAVGVQKIAK